jgi:carboxylesterase type B
MKTIKERSIYAYEGIPFAESTGGPNRFKVGKIEGSRMVDIDYMLNIDRRMKYSI